MGGFVNRMFEFRSKPCFVWLARASSIDAHEGEQRRKQAGGGVFCLGTLFWTSKIKYLA